MEHEESRGYEIIKQLSHGTFGTVFKAKSKSTGKIVALKKVYKDISKPENRKLLEREIGCMRSVIHPNVIEVLSNFNLPKSV
jgi:serine/threonine protein kinase